ncbi:DUF1285 domain-containing protein [Pelagibacteraceae bacterium]|jgi:hypothetical protein|nr:DUF1285 domain-containing protein [Pelagibacterales bacterium SAG-MED32]MDC3086405.1 DUF1285 domain-containing protein [Pelagibacteraceae bacterium]MDC3204929.1 DUF1285 domain-containing protein [Pelagibacteraceae bacterium]|tara:strand:+ start:1008 stop:1589 length:582 start_codon:yes stop_codon:yes gene_type:complete
MSDDPVNLKGIETIYSFSKSNKKSLPPIEKWNPPFCGDIDMTISKSGKWYYMGSEIKRPAMVKLFSGILRLESDNSYYLVTPVEKVRIQVEDAPFVAVAITKEQSEGMNTVTFRTNLNDEIVLSKENPLSIEIKKNDEPSPYITVRNNLRALISRSVFYELVDLAETIPIDGVPYLAIKSQGEIFKIHKVEDL